MVTRSPAFAESHGFPAYVARLLRRSRLKPWRNAKRGPADSSVEALAKAGSFGGFRAPSP